MTMKWESALLLGYDRCIFGQRSGLTLFIFSSESSPAIQLLQVNKFVIALKRKSRQEGFVVNIQS